MGTGRLAPSDRSTDPTRSPALLAGPTCGRSSDADAEISTPERSSPEATLTPRASTFLDPRPRAGTVARARFTPARASGLPARSISTSGTRCGCLAIAGFILADLVAGVAADLVADFVADLGPALAALATALRALTPALASTTRRLRLFRPLPGNTIPMPQTVAV